MFDCDVANIAETHGIELVQRPELSIRIPPLGGHPLEFLDLLRINGPIQQSGIRVLS
jgi:hypothetical protein